MKRQVFRITLIALLACGTSFAAEQTWTGRIISNMCNAADSGGMTHECIMNCIKAGGKYVFVNKGNVHTILNQNFSDLESNAGHPVKLTGELGSDGTSITVVKVSMTSETVN